MMKKISAQILAAFLLTAPEATVVVVVVVVVEEEEEEEGILEEEEEELFKAMASCSLTALEEEETAAGPGLNVCVADLVMTCPCPGRAFDSLSLPPSPSPFPSPFPSSFPSPSPGVLVHCVSFE